MALEPKRELTFVNSKGIVIADDRQAVFLALVPNQPGQITAFISPETHRLVENQFCKNPSLDGVVLTTSLTSLVSEALEFFEDEPSLDRWLISLEEAAEKIRSFKRERQVALATTFCESCFHPASDHFVPHVGELNCKNEACNCEEFFPLTVPTAKTDINLSGPAGWRPKLLRAAKG